MGEGDWFNHQMEVLRVRTRDVRGSTVAMRTKLMYYIVNALLAISVLKGITQKLRLQTSEITNALYK